MSIFFYFDSSERRRIKALDSLQLLAIAPYCKRRRWMLDSASLQ